MAATVLLRCDAATVGCPATLEVRAPSAAAAREEALSHGWATRRTTAGRAGPVRDYCAACATRLGGGMRNLTR